MQIVQFDYENKRCYILRSEAQKRADVKYHAKTYKNLQISARIADYELIDNYCKSIGMSKAATIVNAIKYLIENNVNLAEWIKKEKQAEDAGQLPGSGDAENN